MGFTCLGFSNSDHKDIKLNAVYRKNGTRICNIFVFFCEKIKCLAQQSYKMVE